MLLAMKGDIIPIAFYYPPQAPEIVTQDLPTLASDMWSVGVFTYVM